MKRKIRAAVIGAGAIAVRHVQTMLTNDRTELTAIADIDLQKAKALAGKNAAVYADYKEMIKQERPEVVVITLPHYLHKEAALFSAAHNCHVLLEKPMAMNAAESREIIRAADHSGIVLAVGHMQHYYPAIAEAKRMVASGKLGRLVMVNDKRYGNYFREERPDWFLQREKSGGGVVINLGSHSIDKVHWITGRQIVKVRAVLSYYGTRGDVEGSGCLFMLTEDDVPVTSSICSYGGKPLQETELLFTKGKIKVCGSDALWISEGGDYKAVALERGEDAFARQWKAMIEAIEHGTELSNSGQYSAGISAVVDAAYRSHVTGIEEETGIALEV